MKIFICLSLIILASVISDATIITAIGGFKLDSNELDLVYQQPDGVIKEELIKSSYFKNYEGYKFFLNSSAKDSYLTIKIHGGQVPEIHYPLTQQRDLLGRVETPRYSFLAVQNLLNEISKYNPTFHKITPVDAYPKSKNQLIKGNNMLQITNANSEIINEKTFIEIIKEQLGVDKEIHEILRTIKLMSDKSENEPLKETETTNIEREIINIADVEHKASDNGQNDTKVRDDSNESESKSADVNEHNDINVQEDDVKDVDPKPADVNELKDTKVQEDDVKDGESKLANVNELKHTKVQEDDVEDGDQKVVSVNEYKDMKVHKEDVKDRSKQAFVNDKNGKVRTTSKKSTGKNLLRMIGKLLIPSTNPLIEVPYGVTDREFYDAFRQMDKKYRKLKNKL
jgi:hypothetical protein